MPVRLLLQQKKNEGKYHDREYNSLSRKERVRVLQKYGLCFLFGGEESYGSLVGDYVNDKDAVTVTAMFTEWQVFIRKRADPHRAS